MSRVVHFHGTEAIIHEPTGVLLQPGPNEIASDEHAELLLESGHVSEHPAGEAVAATTGESTPDATGDTGESTPEGTTPDVTSEGGGDPDTQG
jgi:hypothetical protein